MVSEVLASVAATSGLAGLLVVTADADAAEMARRVGARVVTDGARDGHTESVNAAIRMLVREGRTELAAAALRIMEEKKITSVLVADAAGRLEGVVHVHDLWTLQLF